MDDDLIKLGLVDEPVCLQDRPSEPRGQVWMPRLGKRGATFVADDIDDR